MLHPSFIIGGIAVALAVIEYLDKKKGKKNEKLHDSNPDRRGNAVDRRHVSRRSEHNREAVDHAKSENHRDNSSVGTGSAVGSESGSPGSESGKAQRVKKEPQKSEKKDSKPETETEAEK